MAKKDSDKANDTQASKAKTLEEKVDSYMDVAKPEPASEPMPHIDPPASPEPPKPIAASVPAVNSAPLLPTEKLPDLGSSKKTAKIPIIDHSEPEPPADIKKDEALPAPPVAKDDLGLEDVGMSKAVDEIIAAEADEVLDAEDKKHEPVVAAPPPRLSQKIKRFFAAWWHNKLYRNSTIALFFVGLLVAGVLPASRYALLNTAGVRASTSMTVLDDKTGLPLKNVELSMSGQTAKTDVDGHAKLEKIKLGAQTLSIKKPAFAEINQKLTIGWGSNPRGDVRLTPVGIQYKFKVTDFLSNKPIVKVEASAGQASALSNNQGEIILTVPDTDETDRGVQISAADYRTETAMVSASDKQDINVQLVPGRKHAFVSKRDGTLDVYKIDVDGKNEEKALKGTGSEREDAIALASHPSKSVAALISTRDGSRNKDGFTLSVLTLIDLGTNETKTLAQSERIQLVDWIGDRLVYVKIAEGTSAASPTRHRLMSYDLESGTDQELVSTNYFNDIVSARGAIYYSPAVYKVNGSVGLFRINADGTNKKTLHEREVWNIFRTAFDTLNISVGQEWYQLNMDSEATTKVPAAPTQLKSRVYADSPDGKKSLWVDERDGKGALIVYDKESRTDKVAITQSGIKTPIRWLSNKHIVYRVTTPQETADYVVNLEGGEAKKIRDVTNTAGIDRWYYY